MAPSAHPALARIEFTNFKAFRKFSVALDHVNVLVGPNNAGKSTVIAALRVLEAGLRRARGRSPERLPYAEQQALGYSLSRATLPISTENVATDYDDVVAKIAYRLSNGNRLEVHFPPDRQFYMVANTEKGPPHSAAQFKAAFPISLTLVPPLGPLEHEEPLVQVGTVDGALATHRASRHFRNYWRNNPENFGEFAALLRQTWPGMEIEQPELVTRGVPPSLAMYCRENRATRELYWAGVGFQIWCQLLTHIIRSTGTSLLVIDEPEIYLHPDVQRQLLGLLRSRGVDVLLATHSTEIIGEADPDEILLIEKTRAAAHRLRDMEGVQGVLDTIGSVHNIALTQLARTRRLVFTEGEYDAKVIRRFAGLLGHLALSTGSGMTHVESDGFAGWERIRDFSWGLQKTVGSTLKIAAIFDRDFFAPEEIAVLLDDLRKHIALAVVLERKEIENYLLVPNVLQRALERTIADGLRRGQKPGPAIDIALAIQEIATP
jgi:hypothetical protein